MQTFAIIFLSVLVLNIFPSVEDGSGVNYANVATPVKGKTERK